ncbi:hypothetical protein Q4610_07625 [Sphingobium sp. HBC34]|uniref:Transposase zinc-ribbon domain-containing protein n=1 Tax=Sphingobium cyanobacteriorum TaxID=3063954 RepID=A0ABT8ZK49_9SPHN|nr:hypothetical protein [Sphingobium sp. HBC34]MDO7834915.1 hypothetical protein [Sphingobium sp. HBC34]
MPLPASDSIKEAYPALLSYRPGRAMACPSCGERQWLVGRIVAQCACCDIALPIDPACRGWSRTADPSPRIQPFPIA